MSFGVDPRNPLEYAGIQYFLMPCTSNPRAPLTTDYNFPINTIWRVGNSPTGAPPSTGTVGDQWILVNKTGSITQGNFFAQWVQFVFGGVGPGDLIELTGDDGVAVLPTLANINLLGNTVANATHAKPLYTHLQSATISNMQFDIQVAGEFGSSNINNAGLASFNNVDFNVDANGYVTSNGRTVNWQTISASQTLVVNNGYFCIAPGGALSLLLPATATIGDIIEITLDGSTSWSITQAAGQQIRYNNLETTLGATGSITTTDQGNTIRMVAQSATKWNILSALDTLTVA